MNLRDKILIEAFCAKLNSQGISQKTCGRHRDHLTLFADAYLDESEGMELKEVDGDTMRYFLASWYPRSVKASKTELLELIATFRKFYAFMSQLRIIDQDALEELISVLSRKRYFVARLKDCQRGEYGPGFLEEQAGAALRSPFAVDQSLYLLARNLTKPAVPIVLDFQLFLDYLANHHIRLNPQTATLPSKDLQHINQRFSDPEELPATIDQNSIPRLSIFYQLARSLDLFLIGSELELLVTPRAEMFLEMDPDQQLVVLLDALWNRVRWNELSRFGADGFAGWAQDHRGGFAELLSRLPPGVPWPVAGKLSHDHISRLLANYLSFFEVVETRVMFALREMGLLDYELKPDCDPYPLKNSRGISIIFLTKFGKKIMKYLARKSRDEEGGNSLVELLEDGFIFM